MPPMTMVSPDCPATARTGQEVQPSAAGSSLYVKPALGIAKTGPALSAESVWSSSTAASSARVSSTFATAWRADPRGGSSHLVRTSGAGSTLASSSRCRPAAPTIGEAVHCCGAGHAAHRATAARQRQPLPLAHIRSPVAGLFTAAEHCRFPTGAAGQSASHGPDPPARPAPQELPYYPRAGNAADRPVFEAGTVLDGQAAPQAGSGTPRPRNERSTLAAGECANLGEQVSHVPVLRGSADLAVPDLSDDRAREGETHAGGLEPGHGAAVHT